MEIKLIEYNTDEILHRVLAGSRPTPDEAIHLAEHADLLQLGMAAQTLEVQANPERLSTFIVDRTIVYSNVCQPNCPFCAGTVARDDPRAFTLSAEDVVAQVGAAVQAGARQIILQGGHRLDLPWSYYTGLLAAVKAAYPQVELAAYSPTEIMVFNTWFRHTTRAVLADLKAAGLDVLLAGGAESMPSRAPENRALLKGPWNEWFDILHRCHELGIPAVATFPFGLGESARERVGHLYRTRAVQARTGQTGQAPVFRALVPFPAAPVDPDELLKRVGAGQEPPEPVSGHEYLRMVALSRVLAENIPVVQASPLTQGAKVAQVALDCGASDFGGTHLQYEQAELAAGRVGPMTAAEFIRLAKDAGRVPARRNAAYAVQERF